MEDYPDEPEDFVPPKSENPAVIKMEVSAYELTRMMDNSINAAMQNYVGRSVEKWVEKKVSAAVDRLVKDITAETITKHVEKTLTEGWGKVNEWGERRGETVTLSSVVRDGLMLMSASRDSYNRDQTSPLAKIVMEMAAQGVKEGLEPIIKESKEQLKAQLDLTIGKTLRMTMGELVK